MKGVILAGGNGTRLYPCTIAINKHLLPIFNKPMIYYPLETLIQAGCTDILIICGDHIGSFVKLIGDGKHLGLKSVLYTYQSKSDGIGGALKLARSFIGNDKFLVILGDNLLFDNISFYCNEFFNDKSDECRVFIKEVKNPCDFGIAELQNNEIINIVEKPKNPISNYAIIGLYMFSPNVFEIIDKLQTSDRGEYEITDINMFYVKNKKIKFNILSNEWYDCGTFESLNQANNIIMKKYFENKNMEN